MFDNKRGLLNHFIFWVMSTSLVRPLTSDQIVPLLGASFVTVYAAAVGLRCISTTCSLFKKGGKPALFNKGCPSTHPEHRELVNNATTAGFLSFMFISGLISFIFFFAVWASLRGTLNSTWFKSFVGSDPGAFKTVAQIVFLIASFITVLIAIRCMKACGRCEDRDTQLGLLRLAFLANAMVVMYNFKSCKCG